MGWEGDRTQGLRPLFFIRAFYASLVAVTIEYKLTYNHADILFPKINVFSYLDDPCIMNIRTLPFIVLYS